MIKQSSSSDDLLEMPFQPSSHFNFCRSVALETKQLAIDDSIMVERNSIGDGISDTGGSNVGFDPINKVARAKEQCRSTSNVR
jgi:hypothetical protein